MGEHVEVTHKNPFLEYIRSNLGRMIEMVIVITVIFVNIQNTVDHQGKILDNITEQQKEQTEVLRQLTLTVTELAIHLNGAVEDINELEEDLESHEKRDDFRDEQIKKHVYGTHK